MKYLVLFVLMAILVNSALVLAQEKESRVEAAKIEELRKRPRSRNCGAAVWKRFTT
jgi:hypothetical protein